MSNATATRRFGSAAPLRVAFFASIVLLASPLASRGQPRRPNPEDMPVRTFAERFDVVWRLVRRRFHDRRLVARRIPSEVLRSYRARAAAAENHEQFAAIVNRMLDRLDTSHCRYWPNTTREFYEVLSIFRETPDLRVPTIGAHVDRLDGAWHVTAVLQRREPNDDDPFVLGDRVVSVDGEPFDPLLALKPRVGKRAAFRVEREPGEFHEVRQTVRNEHPVAPYVEDMLAGVRIIERAGRRIGYCRVWWMGRPETYGAAFHALLELGPADAVIVDLRDGWGGTPSSYYRLFDRNGPFCVCRQPVVALVDHGSRSAKEVVAYDLKKNGRALLVGTRTKGAVMPSAGYRVGDDGLLVLAVGRMRDENYAGIEGHGVEPDIEVPFDPRFANGRDPQLQRAVREAISRLPKAVRVDSPHFERSIADSAGRARLLPSRVSQETGSIRQEADELRSF